ncbi:MAG: hypothetical protein QJR06_01855 [Alicyclobacillaceae bacterium]|nr:hypothetical protein [Alicyclobacillaceae bacterium]
MAQLQGVESVLVLWRWRATKLGHGGIRSTPQWGGEMISFGSRVSNEDPFHQCGPAPMIDASLEVLKAHGWEESNIFFDKFTASVR